MEDVTADYWKSVVRGVLFMIVSTILASLQTTVVKWGSYIGYVAVVILIFRGISQFFLCIIESILQPNLHLIRDIQKIGSVPKRTSMPILFNHGQHMHQYGSFQSMTSISKLNSNNVIESESMTASRSDLNPAAASSTRSCSVFYIIWSAVILRGFFGGVATLLKFQAFILLPIGDVLSLLSLSAVFTPFLAYCCFGDAITISHLLSLCAGIAGIVLIVQPPFIFKHTQTPNSLADASVVGYLYIFSAALVQSLVYVSIQFARKVPVYVLILSQSCWCIITGFVVLLCAVSVHSDEFQRVLWVNSYLDIAYIACLGVIGYSALWFLTKSGQHISSGIVALLSNLTIVWGYILQCVIFKQIPSYITVIGAAMMIAAAMIVSADKIKDARKKSMSVIQRNISTENTINL